MEVFDHSHVDLENLWGCGDLGSTQKCVAVIHTRDSPASCEVKMVCEGSVLSLMETIPNELEGTVPTAEVEAVVGAAAGEPAYRYPILSSSTV